MVFIPSVINLRIIYFLSHRLMSTTAYEIRSLSCHRVVTLLAVCTKQTWPSIGNSVLSKIMTKKCFSLVIKVVIIKLLNLYGSISTCCYGLNSIFFTISKLASSFRYREKYFVQALTARGYDSIFVE